MTREQLSHLLRNPRDLASEDLQAIRQLVGLYPYCASFVFLYLYGLAKSGDVCYPAELKRLAIHLPIRSELYRLVEGKGTWETTLGQETLEARDGFALIDHFLSMARSEGHDLPSELAFDSAEGAGDYFSHEELISTAPLLPTDERPQPHATSPREQGEHHEASSQSPQLLVEDQESEELFTETLAKIYIKQGRYDKALKMMRALSLNYPEKSRYFAHQIRFLERLLTGGEKSNK